MPIQRKRFISLLPFRRLKCLSLFCLNSLTLHLSMKHIHIKHLCIFYPFHLLSKLLQSVYFIDNNFRNISAVNGFGFVSVYSEWCSPFNENAKCFSIFFLLFISLSLSLSLSLVHLVHVAVFRIVRVVVEMVLFSGKIIYIWVT